MYLNRDFIGGLFSDNSTKKDVTSTNMGTITCMGDAADILNQDSLKADADISDITEKLVEKVEESAAEECSKIINDGLPFLVSGGIRNLPEGWSPSAAKIEEAQSLGIILEPNQTIVDPFYKNVA